MVRLLALLLLCSTGIARAEPRDLDAEIARTRRLERSGSGLIGLGATALGGAATASIGALVAMAEVGGCSTSAFGGCNDTHPERWTIAAATLLAFGSTTVVVGAVMHAVGKRRLRALAPAEEELRRRELMERHEPPRDGDGSAARF